MRLYLNGAFQIAQYCDSAPYNGIPEKDKPDEPHRDLPVVAPWKEEEDRYGGKNEKLICERVKKCTEAGSLIVATGYDSISVIRHCGDKKYPYRPPVKSLIGIA